MKASLLLVALAVPLVLSAQAPPRPAFAPDRLARIDRLLQGYVDSNRVGAAVALVLRDGKVAYEKSVGWADREAGRRMTADAIFRLGPAAGWGWYTADKNEPICETMDRLGTLPFVAQPGERFVYGYNLDILGCVIERVSGEPLDQYFRTHITAPLGMSDTYFFVPAAKRDRLVAVYASDSTNHAARAPDGPKGQGNYLDGPRKSFSGSAGVVSTARDYARFPEMIRNGGELGGVRILAPQSVDLMTHDQIGALYGAPGQGFGFGFSTVERFGASGMESEGSYGWGGAYGSTYFVDPRQHMVVVFMINQLPNSADIASKFPTLVYAALVERYAPGREP